MAESTTHKDATSIDLKAFEDFASGEVIQLPDGRAGVSAGTLQVVPSGEKAEIFVDQQHTVTKSASVVIVDGAPLYWDRSANSATPLRAVAGGDFFLGTAVGDYAAADTKVTVALNNHPVYAIDALAGESAAVPVGAATIAMGPGYAALNIIATSEAEKIDILSLSSIPVGLPFIVEGRIMVFDTPSGAATDFDIGFANGTHATDFGSVTERMSLHFDNALDIKALSTDGTTTVTVADTTVDAVEGTYFDFVMDARDLSDVQLYINGVQVLAATVFDLSDATGPLKLIAHCEKTTGTEVGELRVSKLAARITQVAKVA